MKKKIVCMLSLLLGLLLSISLVACSKNKHEAKSEWKYDETQHWHECTAKGHDDKLDVADHKFDDGIITTQPTETEDGIKTFTCNDCGYQKTKPVAKVSHTHTFDTSKWEKDANGHWHASTCGHDVKTDEADHHFDAGVITKAATETEEGEKTFTCDDCGYQKTEPVAKASHTHTFDTSKWEKDETGHWHKATCEHKNEKDSYTKHRWNDGVMTKPATETEEGEKTFTCIDCGQTKTESTGTLSHTHTFDMTKWEKDEAGHWHASTCEHDIKKDEGDHSFDTGVVTKVPTETAEGEKTYTCGVCGYKKTEVLARLDHKHTFDETKWESDETKHWHASSCGHDVRKDEANHKFTDWTVETPASIGVEGWQKRTCSICGYVARRTIPALTLKDNGITVGTINFTYNAKSQPIDSLVAAGNKAGMVIKYIGVDGTTYGESTTAPTNAGTYQYTITIPATAEWKAAEKTGKYTINKYELTEVYGTTHKKEYDGDQNVIVRLKPFGVDTINVQIYMKSANAGAMPYQTVINGPQNDNYTIDQSKIKAEITPKVLSGFSFAVAKSELIGSSGTQMITVTVPNTDGKVSVNIRFDIATLTHEGTLTLITGTPGQGEAQIEFCEEEGDEYKNYEFAASGIGTLTLTMFII